MATGGSYDAEGSTRSGDRHQRTTTRANQTIKDVDDGETYVSEASNRDTLNNKNGLKSGGGSKRYTEDGETPPWFTPEDWTYVGGVKVETSGEGGGGSSEGASLEVPQDRAATGGVFGAISSGFSALGSLLAGVKEGLSEAAGALSSSYLRGTMVEDARQTASNAATAVSNPGRTAAAIGDSLQEGYQEFQEADLNGKANAIGRGLSGFVPGLGWAGRGRQASRLLRAADKVGDAAGEGVEQAAKKSGKLADGATQVDAPDTVTDRLRIQNKAQQARDTAPTRGLGGRTLTPAQRAELNTFADRARARGYVENPHRTGSFGEIVDGKFKERVRIDIGDPSQPGWRGETHLNFPGDRGHYPPNTQLP